MIISSRDEAEKAVEPFLKHLEKCNFTIRRGADHVETTIATVAEAGANPLKLIPDQIFFWTLFHESRLRLLLPGGYSIRD